ATFLGWVIDAFDYNILAFVLIDIQKSFTVDKTLAGALATVTLVMRLAGGVIAGSAADKWGRKLPMMLSILWFSLFAFLSGFSTSYAMLFGFRALVGLGRGGAWASCAPSSPDCCSGSGTGATCSRQPLSISSIHCLKAGRTWAGVRCSGSRSFR